MRGYGGGDTELAIRLHKAFNLPTIFNPSALGHSVMLKTLAFALEQMEQFGGENLRYIRSKHRDFMEGYGLKLFAERTLTSRIVRLLLAPLVVRSIERWIRFAPRWTRNHMMNYAVLGRICNGFTSSTGERIDLVPRGSGARFARIAHRASLTPPQPPVPSEVYRRVSHP